ncbi:MAG: TIGR03621 family F420-dependent LLM class oxidoreductase [Thermomicrobiales bacterium]|nr:TIGR03621 family F420-dependent LLM class oxidoreductase [Thermomicrobiales bacterium]
MNTRPIRFGVMADDVGTPDELIALASWAETSGFSTLLLRDHVIEHTFGHQLGPLVAMALVAASTTKLRIGTLAICNDYRPPVQLAKEIATLDVASGGRVELGLGAGFLEPEYHPLGIPFDAAGVRVSRLQEAVKLLKLLFSGEPVTFHGDYYNVDDFVSFPMPIQDHGIPILVAGSGDRMLRLAAREADIVGIQTASSRLDVPDDPSHRLADVVQQRIDIVRQAAGERFPQIELNAVVLVEVTDDREAAARRIIERRGWSGIETADILAMPTYFIGTLQEIAVQILERRDRYGLSYLVTSQVQAPLLAPLVSDLTGK